MNLEEIIDSLDSIRCIEIPQTTINDHLCQYGHKVAIYDGRLVLNTKDGMEAYLSYYSHKICPPHISLTLEVLKLKPLYYSMALPLIGHKYPCLRYSKASGLKLITCDITQLSGISEILSPYIHRMICMDIKIIRLKDGKIVIELYRDKKETHHV